MTVRTRTGIGRGAKTAGATKAAVDADAVGDGAMALAEVAGVGVDSAGGRGLAPFSNKEGT